MDFYLRFVLLLVIIYVCLHVSERCIYVKYREVAQKDEVNKIHLKKLKLTHYRGEILKLLKATVGKKEINVQKCERNALL